VRIPLDYYRILGVPSEATDEQVSQAYQDRCLQLPRREYGECAIAGRKQLLEQSYSALSDSSKRGAYDRQLSGETAGGEPAPQVTLPPIETGGVIKSASDGERDSIEISEAQLPGALLILQELGDYERAISWGERYLPRFSSPSAQPARSDIALTLALAYLETSLEQWQQGEWEKAAAAASKGLELLQRQQLFPEVQAQLARELYKLRPYRILERVALDSSRSAERQQGLEMLREMLEERQGIDGRTDDRCGLGIDDFLRFVQQLRLYLTAAEQQQLFESEARRPSTTAIYLAAYVLLARGFAEKQPGFILQAQEWLERLGERQDVYLERATCALLLGQTTEANAILEQAPAEEALALIREQSQESPDLIPGLCWYAERWLQTEVLSHFRDLASQQVSLEEYFANESVQAYLDGLLGEIQAAEPARKIDTNWEESAMIAKKRLEDMSIRSGNKREKRHKSALSATAHARIPVLAGAAAGGGTALTVPQPAPPRAESLNLQDYVGELQTAEAALGSALPELSPAVPSPRRRRSKTRTRPQKFQDVQRSTGKRRSKHRWSVDLRRLLPAIALFFGLGSLAVWLLKSQFNPPPLTALQGEQLLIRLNQPPIDLPSLEARLSPPSALSEAEAQAAVEAWLAKKAQAFGKQHQIAALNEILSEPALSIWRKRAETEKNNQSYRQYQHQIQVQSVKSVAPGRAVVEAKVKETTDYYQAGKLSRKQDTSLRVRYTLAYSQDRWLIQNIQVL
jgi:hypothetical protein